ncbi:tRNA adenosine(34) deaminase TadA [Lactococcus protaetiae]|uniref:tRNA-specific adenosine deaminase n=1 Tax=Lactococcus protaetiae TaxID=2592653 RepID=A0A514Z8D9_9LACT|nr:tRNA adenosine(34) deaminase TadA [Lactococcus protaetiae]MCL2113362.1 tRNA adenosine(34) deaminase TadA [Streptococcaceae bacterium]QDK70851.1 nucleoside deaminase [Lactococcus protaetiae]
MNFTLEQKEFFMNEALKEAQKAAGNEEVPIGSVIVKDGEIIARGFNRRELDGKATHHAEICAIEAANQVVNNWRLLDCALFVTIEPCVMCAGAIGLARIPQVYFGATNPKFGGTVSLYQILEDERLNHRVQVEAGILKEECAAIMQNFFKNRRKK